MGVFVSRPLVADQPIVAGPYELAPLFTGRMAVTTARALQKDGRRPSAFVVDTSEHESNEDKVVI